MTIHYAIRAAEVQITIGTAPVSGNDKLDQLTCSVHSRQDWAFSIAVLSIATFLATLLHGNTNKAGSLSTVSSKHLHLHRL